MYERVENKLSNEIESLQRVLTEIVNRLPVANESDLDPIRADIASLSGTTEKDTTATDIAAVDTPAEVVPITPVPEPVNTGSEFVDTPVATTSETDVEEKTDIESFLASASSDQLAQVDAYLKTTYPQDFPKTA